MVDAYTLVFAGLLLTAGSLGDRFGRRGALQVGLRRVRPRLAALGHVDGSPTSSSPHAAFMGIGGAFIMPATLSIITNVFPAQGARQGDRRLGRHRRPRRRARPAHRRLPPRALLLGLDLPREPPDRRRRPRRRRASSSRRRRTRPRRGSTRRRACSRSSGLVSLLYAIIEAPTEGLERPTILRRVRPRRRCCSVTFFVWERHSDHPDARRELLQEPALHAPRAPASRSCSSRCSA